MVVAFLPITAPAQSAFKEKPFSVTSRGADVYGIQGGEDLLLTTRCKVHALVTPSQLKRVQDGVALVFGEPELARCRLRDILRRVPLAEGRYSVRLTLDSDDWYWIEGAAQRLRTVGCERLAKLEPALLFQANDGTGIVDFASGNSCVADGIFSSVQLRGLR